MPVARFGLPSIDRSNDTTRILRFAAGAERLRTELVAERRHLHAHPELGWEEAATTALIADRLQALDYVVTRGRAFLGDVPRLGVQGRGLAETGCVADLDFGRPGPTVAVRVDLDALPITEATTGHRPAVEGWASANPGVMHACGHDGHLAIGLATARLLSESKGQSRGRLRLIFQPAEEGTRGARSVVEAGWLRDVDLLLAFHIGLGVPSGAVALGTSGFLATRKYRAVMTGRPAHAGQAPEQGRNALVAACQAVLGLHTLAQSSAPGVRVNVGTLRAGSALNVVAHHAEFGFELRAERQATLDELTLRALTLLDGIAAAHDIAVETLLCGEATDWANPTELTEWAHNVAVAGGIFAQHRLQHGFGASDDATLMMQAVAGQGGHAAYFVFGADLTSGHHTPTFDFDENVLVDGTALLTALAGTMLAGGVELRSTGQPVPT